MKENGLNREGLNTYLIRSFQNVLIHIKKSTFILSRKGKRQSDFSINNIAGKTVAQHGLLQK
jgi:hypothetical protein